MKGTIGVDHRLDVGIHEERGLPSLLFLLHGLDITTVIPQIVLLLTVATPGMPTSMFLLGVVPGKAGSAGVHGFAPPIGLVLVEASGAVKHPMTTFAEKVASFKTVRTWVPPTRPTVSSLARVVRRSSVLNVLLQSLHQYDL